MTTWTPSELDAIGRAEELEISSARGDGSLTKPVTIWVVRCGDDLYVRSAVTFAKALWYRATKVSRTGHISAGGVEKDVAFVAAEREKTEEVDAAYWTKYGKYAKKIVEPCVSREAKATTIRLVPR